MAKTLFFFAMLALATGSVSAKPNDPLVNTFSIVAYDSSTGQFGAAVQSHYFRVADVIWAEPGVGAVATQSFVEFSYGPLGLTMMRTGKTAQQALQSLLSTDSARAVRQVAMIDKHGNVAVHTGEKCIAEAGNHTGKFYSCQANLMAKNTVWDAMAKAYETTKGPLEERLMAALEAAQGQGGDIRGMQSAAILVVSATNTGQPWKDRQIDLRVDDSPQPLKELRRLLQMQAAYRREDRGDELVAEGNIASAEAEYAEAARLAPDNLELRFWEAVTLASNKNLDKALPIFKEIFAKDTTGGWKALVPRLVKSDLLPNDQKLVDEILKQ